VVHLVEVGVFEVAEGGEEVAQFFDVVEATEGGWFLMVRLVELG
jgi:hypothetical protein